MFSVNGWTDGGKSIKILYHSIIKRNTFSSCEGGECNCILLTEEANLKATYINGSTIWHSVKGKTVDTVKGSVISRMPNGCGEKKE